MLRLHGAALAAAVTCLTAACSHGPAPSTNAPQVPARPANSAANASPAPSHGSAAEVRFRNEDGTTFTIADLPGKAKVINFWATWCAPCLHEMPLLNDLSKKYASKDVTFVAVSVDENGPKDVKPFLERNAGR